MASKNPLQLSTQEEIVLSLAAAGNTNREIARKLQSSIYTIQDQLSSAYAKLGARNRTHACVKAVVLGFIEYDESFSY